jgi:hypothetical protein
MDMLARRPNRVASRFLYGSVAYWGLNVVLAVEEIKWHLIYRLTLWDISQLKVVGPVLFHLVRAHITGS